MAEARQRLTAAGIAADELDELEDHLREQHADILSRGLRPDEAWWLTERRLGPPSEEWSRVVYGSVS